MEKIYIKYLFISQVLVIIFIMALNFIVDPLLYYKRNKRPHHILYTEDNRYLIPGLIKNSPDYNAVIVGSSMAGNFIASEVGRTLGEKTLKLSIDGATLFEQHYVISKYFETHQNAKIVIWGIDLGYVSGPAKITTRENYNYPYFLYDNTMVNPKYLLNYDITVHSFQTITNNLIGINFFMKKRDINKVHTWDTPTGCQQVIDHYKLISTEHLDEIYKNFDKNNAEINLNKIVELAIKKKDVQFYIFLPPYSIVRYYISYEHNALEFLLKARNFIAGKVNGISNIKIIDLQASNDIISNLNYYKDMGHYNRIINDIIMKKIIDGSFTEYEAILSNTKKLKSLISALDFEKVRKCEEYK
jgi:hypothetical protein